MSTNKIQDLFEFVQKASKLGKYNANTGSGIINAIKAAEKGLMENEPRDLNYLIDHMEELFLRQKNLSLSPQSQAIYFTRIKKAVDDFQKYGSDARSIYSWSPKNRIKKVNNKKQELEKSDESPEIENTHSKQQVNNESSLVKEVNGVKLNVVTWRLRPGVLIKVDLPEDLSENDVAKIKKLLDLEIDN